MNTKTLNILNDKSLLSIVGGDPAMGPGGGGGGGAGSATVISITLFGRLIASFSVSSAIASFLTRTLNAIFSRIGSGLAFIPRGGGGGPVMRGGGGGGPANNG